MIAPLWFQNLFAYNLQVAVLAVAGLLLPRLVRLRTPRVLYAYGQVLLAACLLLPLVQPWQRFEAGPGGTGASRIFFDSGAAARVATWPAAGLILLVLAGGTVGRLAWLALGLAGLARHRQSARRFEPLPPVIREMGTHLGVAPEFRVSEEIQGPVTFGLWRPVILLPPHFGEMDADRQQAIAVHEMLHVARLDWIFNIAEEIILAGFWFHPAVWWLVGRIRLSREQVVDRQVVELTGARQPYLYALVEIAAGPGAVRGLVAPAFLNECQLAERIRTLIKEDFMSKRRIAVTVACVAVLTLVAGLAIIRKFPLKAGSVPASAPNPMQTPLSAFSAANGGTPPDVVFNVGNGVSEPVPIYKPDPPYTKEARAAKVEGTVVLWIVVGVDGTVTDAKVVKATDQGLTENAVDTVKTWKFKPAMKDGKAVPCKVMVEVSFRIF
ncbi:MAG: M56 family metallopeptidase [Terriglobia bacterium]|jgi:TonB family protein